ncbi:hypothetical protein JOB18_029200 [Solea senegalensis]|uniref:Uncharacterized protein n=1 Tax=Solea senegalensis TaxID=28829 RepID=A0AAV6PVN8_SOLSE|nr:hypothetical protein JOB18_029200 [Solea senegalensis]
MGVPQKISHTGGKPLKRRMMTEKEKKKKKKKRLGPQGRWREEGSIKSDAMQLAIVTLGATSGATERLKVTATASGSHGNVWDVEPLEFVWWVVLLLQRWICLKIIPDKV